jgi:urea transport system substrate-binding protein
MLARLRTVLPSAWVALPVLGACLIAVLATMANGPVVGAIAGGVTGLIAAFAIERPLRLLAQVAARIASGDRYAIVPKQPNGPLSELAEAADGLRGAVIEADALAIDQRRREAESRLHFAGRSFFTRRFRSAVDDVTNAFADGSGRIGNTAADLAEKNRHMHVRIASASDATEAASSDVNAIAAAARTILARLKRSAGDIDAARSASERAVGDLASADDTVRLLAQAAGRIGEVVTFIQAIARQTSLLALNASIEAVRAGESGQGFAVVASGVKKLAGQTAQATEDIAQQVKDIQQQVERTADALTNVHASVGSIHEADRQLRDMLEQQTAELDEIALRAANVASQVAGALPDIRSAVGHVDQAGQSVLGTAEELIDRSQGLVNTVGRYFTDLDTGAIKVGILHSLSGTMTASERPLQELLVMLIEQLNTAGGLLGRPVEAVIMNPRSDARAYATQARALIAEHKVAAIFGCWTSASRKEVLPVVEQLDGLLFYPSQYEGEEESLSIFYTGATPQQQALPAVDYLIRQDRKRFFLLGTDTVYPRTTNAILKSYLRAQGIERDHIAEFYTPFNHKDWNDIVEWIRRFGAAGDAAVVTTVSGDANIYFYRELARQGLTAEHMPAMTLSIGEGELPAIAGPEMGGHFACWSYLHEIDSAENKAFVTAWRRFCGAPHVVTDDPMEATWIGFNLWKEAVALEGSVAVGDVRHALGGLRVRAPSGFEVVMDLSNHHLHKPAVIGRITADGRIVPIWMSQGLIAPEPWSPWLDRTDRDTPRNGTRQELRDFALAG